MKKIIAAVLFTLCCTSVGFAQDEHERVEFSAGYSHNRVDLGFTDDDDLEDLFSNREGFNGFYASLVGNPSRYVGIKGEYAYHRKSFDFNEAGFTGGFRTNLHNFVGGIQIKDNKKEGKFKPFFHAMAGVARVSADLTGDFDDLIDEGDLGDTGFSAVIGGGIDVRANDTVSVRIVQLDWNPMRFSGDNLGGVSTGSQTLHNFRIGAGIVFH
jgi:hypothetical protein